MVQRSVSGRARMPAVQSGALLPVDAVRAFNQVLALARDAGLFAAQGLALLPEPGEVPGGLVGAAQDGMKGAPHAPSLSRESSSGALSPRDSSKRAGAGILKQGAGLGSSSARNRARANISFSEKNPAAGTGIPGQLSAPAPAANGQEPLTAYPHVPRLALPVPTGRQNQQEEGERAVESVSQHQPQWQQVEVEEGQGFAPELGFMGMVALPDGGWGEVVCGWGVGAGGAGGPGPQVQPYVVLPPPCVRAASPQATGPMSTTKMQGSSPTAAPAAGDWTAPAAGDQAGVEDSCVLGAGACESYVAATTAHAPQQPPAPARRPRPRMASAATQTTDAPHAPPAIPVPSGLHGEAAEGEAAQAAAGPVSEARRRRGGARGRSPQRGTSSVSPPRGPGRSVGTAQASQASPKEPAASLPPADLWNRGPQHLWGPNGALVIPPPLPPPTMTMADAIGPGLAAAAVPEWAMDGGPPLYVAPRDPLVPGSTPARPRNPVGDAWGGSVVGGAYDFSAGAAAAGSALAMKGIVETAVERARAEVIQEAWERAVQGQGEAVRAPAGREAAGGRADGMHGATVSHQPEAAGTSTHAGPAVGGSAPAGAAGSKPPGVIGGHFWAPRSDPAPTLRRGVQGAAAAHTRDLNASYASPNPAVAAGGLYVSDRQLYAASPTAARQYIHSSTDQQYGVQLPGPVSLQYDSRAQQYSGQYLLPATAAAAVGGAGSLPGLGGLPMHMQQLIMEGRAVPPSNLQRTPLVPPAPRHAGVLPAAPAPGGQYIVPAGGGVPSSSQPYDAYPPRQDTSLQVRLLFWGGGGGGPVIPYRMFCVCVKRAPSTCPLQLMQWDAVTHFQRAMPHVTSMHGAGDAALAQQCALVRH